MNMTTAGPPGARPAIYIVVMLLVLVGAFAAKLRLQGAFSCPARYGDHAYLADCSSPHFGDYDHGAFWYGMEPSAVSAASKARVLVLGSSRVQFGFSSPETVRWFGQRSIPFYMLGFTHYESVTFLTPIMDKVRPRPSAYVINADRFFEDWLSAVSRGIFYDRDSLAKYKEKRFWLRPHKALCETRPYLCGQVFAIYRNVDNGTWFTAGRLPDEPSGVADVRSANVEQWPHHIELARKFVDGLKVDRRCVILTIVPTRETARDEAEAIANALGVAFIAPGSDGLSTFDGSHLDTPSASRWSAAFLDAAGPLLERCAASAVPGPG